VVSPLTLSLLLWAGADATHADSFGALQRPAFELLGEEADRSAEDEHPCGSIAAPSLQLNWPTPLWLTPEEAVVEASSHTDKRGEVSTYEQIGRRWDRPTDYELYRYPVARCIGWPSVLSGYDLDKPDAEQRRGTMRAVGHGGLDLPQAMGAPISMVPLAHQVGDAEIVYVGPLFGNTVVTAHALREGTGIRHYVLLFGHLSEPAPGLVRGRTLAPGALVGLVGDSESPNLVHLHLEARRLKDDVAPSKLSPDAILTRTVVTDPRNVLPLRSATARPCKDRWVSQERWLGALRLERAGSTALPSFWL
jgi:hypothetical protein